MKKTSNPANQAMAFKIANDRHAWIPYFDSLARYYLNAFFENMPMLQNWLQKLEQEKDDPTNFNQNQVVYKELSNYYHAFAALSPREDGTCVVDEKIMSEFHEVTLTSPRAEEQISKRLGLRKYTIMGHQFTLNQLMNIMISFYKNPQVREDFFAKIIETSEEEIDNVTLRDLVQINQARPLMYLG